MSSSSQRSDQASASVRIADAIRTHILEGGIAADQKLPSEQDLASRFGVSRPTVREALKRLAAQNLIRTRRGASGGSFVNKVSFEEAKDQVVATATLLMGMNTLPATQVAEARLVLMSAVAPLACARRTEEHIATMRGEVDRQRDPELTDEEFCASDVRFHRALADAADNQLLSFQMAGVIEAVQPLLNMVTWRGRDRAEVAARHARIAAMCERRDANGVLEELRLLSDYIVEQVRSAQALRAKKGRRNAAAR